MFDFKFDWNEDLLLNIDSVDSQHKELFRIGREIEQLIMTRCIGVDIKRLLKIVCELREYVSYHFYFEEELMRKANYSDIENHVKSHELLADKILKIDLPELGKNPFEELSKIKVLLQDWVFQHMIDEDRKMAEEIRNLI